MAFPITAVMVSYNSATVLPDCIDALRQHLEPEQVIVVDNASADTSVRVARDLSTEVIANSSNLGYGSACNLGASAAKHDIVMFLNPDVCITSVDTTVLREFASRSPLGLVAPRTLVVGEPGHHEPALRKYQPWPFNVAREAFGPILPRELSNQRGTSRSFPRAQPWLNGALLIGSRAEFVGLGGFDERLFLYYEDMELSRRYVRHGLPLFVTDAITARHALGGSSGVKDAPSAIVSAASAMSSIEVVGITHGPRSAYRAWVLYRQVRRLATAFLRLSARGPLSTRSQRKLREFRRTQAAVTALLAQSGGQYPLIKTFAEPTRD
jgi:N-acetylglucosaminyl-diphospho-decaprenol L-rhamnosyltransferase